MTKKETRSTTPELYIGLDVHKSSISIAHASADGAKPIFLGKTGGSNLCVERKLLGMCKSLDVTKEDLRLCYDCHSQIA